MNLKKVLPFVFMLISACVTPSFAQVFWSNQSPSGITDDIWCVTYANGTFAAVTDKGNLLTSADGLTWRSQSIDSGVLLVSIAYGNGTWVAVGAGGVVLVSNDLKTWVSAKAVTSNQLNGVAYGGGFTPGAVGVGPNPQPIASIWCAVGENATVITSPDALNWTVQPVPASVTGFLHGISYVGYAYAFGEASTGEISQFVVCGAQVGNGTVNDGGVIFSVGNAQATLVASNLESILINTNSAEVAVGWGEIISAPYSTSFALGAGALTYAVVPNVTYRALTYGNGYWVAAGEQGTILSSPDGMNWTQRFSGDSPSTLSASTLLSAAYSEPLQRFVVTGTDGTILVSNAAPTSFGNVSTRGYVSSSQTFIGGFYVQGTAPRTVLIRGDGPVLSTFSVPNSLPDPVLTVYNSSGAVVATNTGWTTNTTPSAISAAAQQVGAFALPNPGADSALLLTLPPGTYTVQITSAKGNSGAALFEAYTN